MKSITALMRYALLLAFCLIAGTASWGQSKKPDTNNAAKAVEAAVRTLFNGMRTSDSTVAGSVLAPNAKLTTVTTGKDGQVQLQETPIRKFLAMIAQPHPKILDERIWNVKVQIDGPLATLWCDYAFYLGDTFSHCGTDAFQMYKAKDGWKIFSIADTRRKEGCDLTAAGAAN